MNAHFFVDAFPRAALENLELDLIARSNTALHDELTRVEAERDLLAAALRRLYDEIEDNVDVDDGSYGQPKPNWAMRLVNDHGDEIVSALAKVRR